MVPVVTGKFPSRRKTKPTHSPPHPSGRGASVAAGVDYAGGSGSARPAAEEKISGYANGRRPATGAPAVAWTRYFLPAGLPSPESEESAAMKASCGTSTRPTIFIRFLPSFCFSSSLRFRLMSPP